MPLLPDFCGVCVHSRRASHQHPRSSPSACRQLRVRSPTRVRAASRHWSSMLCFPQPRNVVCVRRPRARSAGRLWALRPRLRVFDPQHAGLYHAEQFSGWWWVAGSWERVRMPSLSGRDRLLLRAKCPKTNPLNHALLHARTRACDCGHSSVTLQRSKASRAVAHLLRPLLACIGRPMMMQLGGGGPGAVFMLDIAGGGPLMIPALPVDEEPPCDCEACRERNAALDQVLCLPRAPFL